MEHFLAKINIRNKEEQHFVYFKCNDSQLEITLTTGKETLFGKCDCEEVRNLSLNIDVTVDECLKLTQQALKGDSTDEFYFTLEDETNNSFKFIWKRLLLDGTKYQIGEMLMRRENKNENNISTILNQLLQQSKSIEEKLIERDKQYKHLQKEYDTSLQRMKEYTKVKDSLEQDLFNKFVLVLNEKKKKIRELKNKGEATYSESTESENDVGNTDDEAPNTAEKDVVPINQFHSQHTSIETKPTTFPTSSSHPSSLLHLDCEKNDSDDNDDVPNKRRARKKTSNKKGESTVIPKTAPKKRLSSGSSSSSPSQTKRSKPEKTEGSTDVDQLLDELF